MGALDILTRWVPRPSQPYMEPEYIGQTTPPGPFWKGNTFSRFAVPLANTNIYGSPWIPISRDYYQQLALRTSGQTVSGTAPTSGIFTGLHDEEC